MTVQFSVLVEKKVQFVHEYKEALTYARTCVGNGDHHVSMHRATPAEIEAFDDILSPPWNVGLDNSIINPENGALVEDFSSADSQDIQNTFNMFASQHPVSSEYYHPLPVPIGN